MAEGGATVFVIDDEASVRKALARLLRSAGHSVETFASADAFLKCEHHDAPGCLVLDVRMPGRTGLDLQEALGVARIFYSLELVDTHRGVALAHVSVCAPYAILVLAATFEGLDERVLEATGVCGANTVKRFVYVVLPLIMPGILASMIFSFTHSYNEFTLTLLTYGPHTVTLPAHTYLAVGDGYWEITSAIAMIMVTPSLVILAVIQRRAKPNKLVGGFNGV